MINVIHIQILNEFDNYNEMDDRGDDNDGESNDEGGGSRCHALCARFDALCLI